MSLSLIGCSLRSGMTSENGPTGCNYRLAENARIRLRSPPAPCDISLSFSTSSVHESSLVNSPFLRRYGPQINGLHFLFRDSISLGEGIVSRITQSTRWGTGNVMRAQT